MSGFDSEADFTWVSCGQEVSFANYGAGIETSEAPPGASTKRALTASSIQQPRQPRACHLTQLDQKIQPHVRAVAGGVG